MKLLISFLLFAPCILSLTGQNIPHIITEIPVPPTFTRNFEEYKGRTLYRYPLLANFDDPKKVGKYLSDFSLKVLTIDEYTSPETFEEQSVRYTAFYKQQLHPEMVPYTGPVNLEKTNEPDISVLKTSEASRVAMYATGEIEWYYRESEDVLRRFLIYHHNFPEGLHISEEIYTKDNGPTPLPLPEELHFPVMPQSTFLPEESNLNYQYIKAENSTTVVGNIVFLSNMGFDETVKYFENKLNTKAEQSYNKKGVYFKKTVSKGFIGWTILSIEYEPQLYQDTKISDGRVLISYNYFLPKCNHKIVLNGTEIFK